MANYSPYYEKNLQKAEKVKLSRILNISRQFLNDLELQKFSKHHSIYLYHIFERNQEFLANITREFVIF